MAPQRSRQHEDSRSEASSTKERPAVNGTKNRRTTTAAASSLRDMATAGAKSAAAEGVSANANAEPNIGIQWQTFDPSILHGYRHDYHLQTPAAFNSANNQMILSRSSIGRMSPTMARRKDQRKQSQETLAVAVRRHFNSMGIVEVDVIVDFLYKVRFQDKNFRMRFQPQRPR